MQPFFLSTKSCHLRPLASMFFPTFSRTAYAALIPPAADETTALNPKCGEVCGPGNASVFVLARCLNGEQFDQ